jgi:hypothetical protein
MTRCGFQPGATQGTHGYTPLFWDSGWYSQYPILVLTGVQKFTAYDLATADKVRGSHQAGVTSTLASP